MGKEILEFCKRSIYQVTLKGLFKFLSLCSFQ